MTDFFKARGIDRFVPIHDLIDWLASEDRTKFDPDREVAAERPVKSWSDPPGRKPLSQRGQELARMYRAAEAEFACRAFNRDIIVRGFLSGDPSRARVQVPNDLFEGIRTAGAEFPDERLLWLCVTDDDVHYLEYTVVDDGRGGSRRDDRIMKAGKVLFSGLVVEIGDVLQTWGLGFEKEVDLGTASVTADDADWFAKQWRREYVPLSAALLWIASGGRIERGSCNIAYDELDKMQTELISALQLGKLKAIGRRGCDPTHPEEVPAVEFNCRVSPFRRPTPIEWIFGEQYEPVLNWYSLADAGPDSGPGDKIWNRTGTVWCRLAVMRCEVERWSAPNATGHGAAQGINEQKRLAVDLAIQAIGLDQLNGMKQKEREAHILDHCKSVSGVEVTDRYVRIRLKTAKGERS